MTNRDELLTGIGLWCIGMGLGLLAAAGLFGWPTGSLAEFFLGMTVGLSLARIILRSHKSNDYPEQP
jgi:hypothetical protein